MQVMFDLDGTLTDSRIGVTRCIQHALSQAGAHPPPIEDLTRYVGPPLAASFAQLLGTPDSDQIEQAIGTYRRRFEAVGMFENCLYPGIENVLESLEADGHHMHVVTAKPRVYAQQILEHFGIVRFFQCVHGPELGARTYSKELLIREARADVLSGDWGVMIGDRAEDVLGARSNGLGSVAVTWGYGDRAELEAAQPDRIVASRRELLECVRALHRLHTEL